MRQSRRILRRYAFFLYLFFEGVCCIVASGGNIVTGMVVDSLYTNLNDDPYCDLIVLEANDEVPPEMRLRIFFGTEEKKLEIKKDVYFTSEGTKFAPKLYVDNSKNICLSYIYYKTATTYSFKYFQKYEDWFLYSSYDDIQDDAFPNSRLNFVWPLFETRAIGAESGDWIDIVTTSEKDSVSQRLAKLHNQFFEDFRSKNFNAILNFEIEEYYAVLRYVGIEESNVQHLNDIGFFILKAGKCRDAIIILEDIIKSFPARTVAYLNLGDAYQCDGNIEDAKEMYQKYIDRMKFSGKEAKIPRRVLEQVEYGSQPAK